MAKDYLAKGEMIHKDFHGALSQMFKYMNEKYGEEGLINFWKRLSNTVFGSFRDEIISRGLNAIEEHFLKVIGQEDGEIIASYNDSKEELTLDIKKCPAIDHMKTAGYDIFPKHCEHCRYVNKFICEGTSVETAIDYDQSAGKCKQIFTIKK